MTPQGAVVRKGEIERPRRIGDGGALRRPSGLDGFPNLSVNDAIGIKANADGSPGPRMPDERVVHNGYQARRGQGKWPREVKPTAIDRLQDDLVLKRASELGFGPLLSFGDDMADQFMQIGISPRNYFYCCFQWLNLEEPDELSFVAELRMTYGYSAASNIAQRFVDAVLALFRKRFNVGQATEFERLEQELNYDDPRTRWIRTRRTLSQATGHDECQLYAALGYTDDISITLVGVERYEAAIRCWEGVVRDVKIRMARLFKRQAGTSYSFVGVDNHLTPSIGAIQPDKVLNLNFVLRRVANRQPVLFDEWQSTSGLLEHVLLITGAGRPSMYGVYGRAFAAGKSRGPQSFLLVTDELRERVLEWLERLKSTAGCHGEDLLAIRESRAPVAPTPHALVFRTDAGKEGARVPGLGGYMHGYYFSYPLTAGDLELHISWLEFIAAIVGCRAFAPRAEGLPLHGMVDAKSVHQVLTNHRAHSEVMQLLHLEYLQHPSRLQPASLSWSWIAGEVNVLADAPSRGELDTLRDLAAHLGITLRRIDVDADARYLLDKVHAFLGGSEPPKKRVKPTNAVRIGEASHTGPYPDRALGIIFTIGRVEPPRRAAMHETALRRSQPPSGFAQSVPAWPPSSRISQPSQRSLPLALGRLLVPPRRAPTTSRTATENQPGTRPRSLAFGRTLVPPKRPPTTTRPAATTSENQKRRRMAPVRSDPGVTGEPLRWTRWRLRPRDAAQTGELLRFVASSADRGVPPGTLKQERKTWELWSRYCSEVWSTCPERDNRDAHDGRDRQAEAEEETLLSCFIPWLIPQIPPRAKKDITAKPASVMAHYYSIRRIHKRRFKVRMIQPVRMQHLLRAMVVDFVAANGREALIPERKEPMTAPLLRRLLEVPDGVSIGRIKLYWDSILGISLTAMMCTALEGGFRKDEITLPSGVVFSLMRISLASLAWRIQNLYYTSPTPQQLASLAPGDFAVLTPPPSKTDHFGAYFGGRPVYLPWDDQDPINAAAALARLELARAVPPQRRRSSPLFVSDANGTPMGANLADQLLKGLLEQAIESIERRSRYSWHSFRIGLACALLAAGASPQTIQALCRWKSVESLAIYARLGPEDYGDWLQKARRANVTAIQTTSLPPIDDHSYAAFLAQITDEISPVEDTAHQMEDEMQQA